MCGAELRRKIAMLPKIIYGGKNVMCGIAVFSVAFSPARKRGDHLETSE
jgi:hypothetical protein